MPKSAIHAFATVVSTTCAGLTAQNGALWAAGLNLGIALVNFALMQRCLAREEAPRA